MGGYESLVRRLYQVNLYHPVKMGLTNTLRLYNALGNPAEGVPAVHVAGTNGKGSVSLKVASSLQAGGIRTGLFISPHVACFRERVQVDGELISEERVETLLPKIFDLCEAENIPATFFEITTALAFLHFENSGAQAVVVEAGLGGRLDATNIITPSLSIITSVGLDHTKILGDTIEKIATDKAGIFKPGVPALVGDGCPIQLLRSIAAEKGAPFHRVDDILPPSLPLPGHIIHGKGDSDDQDHGHGHVSMDFDKENSRIAEAALTILGRVMPSLRVDQGCIDEGISQRPPCRFQVLQIPVAVTPPEPGGLGSESKVTVVLDVGHNVPALMSLFNKVKKEFPGRPLRLVLALSSDKDSSSCLKFLVGRARVLPGRIHLAEAATPRAVSAMKLADRLRALVRATAEAGGGRGGGAEEEVREPHVGDGSVRIAVREALTAAAAAASSSRRRAEGGESSRLSESPKAEGEEGDEVVVVCGTVFMMGDARLELGFNEPQDSPWVSEVHGCHLRAAQDNIAKAV